MNKDDRYLIESVGKSYRLKIEIIIEGNAPSKNGEFPFLPISFFEYIQTLSHNYSEKYGEDMFKVIKLTKKQKDKGV